jgi:hypothetical protein
MALSDRMGELAQRAKDAEDRARAATAEEAESTTLQAVLAQVQADDVAAGR